MMAEYTGTGRFSLHRGRIYDEDGQTYFTQWDDALGDPKVVLKDGLRYVRRSDGKLFRLQEFYVDRRKVLCVAKEFYLGRSG